VAGIEDENEIIAGYVSEFGGSEMFVAAFEEFGAVVEYFVGSFAAFVAVSDNVDFY
jgi:hypothetical protein